LNNTLLEGIVIVSLSRSSDKLIKAIIEEKKRTYDDWCGVHSPPAPPTPGELPEKCAERATDGAARAFPPHTSYYDPEYLFAIRTVNKGRLDLPQNIYNYLITDRRVGIGRPIINSC
jgi:hypothetical protein